MRLLNEVLNRLDNEEFDIDFESDMVQSRILSPIIESIEEQGITQEELSKLTGLTQPFISAILNIRKKLNMEHIALFQKALGIVIQVPDVLKLSEHQTKFYSKDDYNLSNVQESENSSKLIFMQERIQELYQFSQESAGHVLVGDSIFMISKGERRLVGTTSRRISKTHLNKRDDTIKAL